MIPSKRQAVIGGAGLAVVAGLAGAAYLAAGGSSDHGSEAESTSSGLSAVLYRSPTCGCCKNYVEYLRRHDSEVEDNATDDVDTVKADHGVPAEAESCHTTIVDDYVIEGHVPLEAIEKLLDERPDVDGIAVPGMPTNSPGMGEPDGRPLVVVSFTDGEIETFMTL